MSSRPIADAPQDIHKPRTREDLKGEVGSLENKMKRRTGAGTVLVIPVSSSSRSGQAKPLIPLPRLSRLSSASELCACRARVVLDTDTETQDRGYATKPPAVTPMGDWTNGGPRILPSLCGLTR
ncbi:uncharacterized protein P884DRAFT_254915 [Thermothelomyces heterothallicus CBS 202.75]|uniref:uncharacterized protein n=1 Tax=Thermothelomyces heterothallicus CBS 202.75 TaxID=1149848 RepID=UPI0037438BF4